MFTKILVPVDGSEPSWKALEYAAEIGRKFNSDLIVTHVIQPFYNAGFLAIPIDSNFLASQISDMNKNAEKILRAASEKIGQYPGKIEIKIENGHPSERILAVATENNCDAIVIGCRGLSGIAEFVLGSVSSNIAQYAKVPVLIVKTEKSEEKK